MGTNEKRLIKNVKKGDQQAFAQLVDNYKNNIFALCLRMVGNRQEAEDLSQETFLRVYKYRDRFDANRKFSTWLYRIATNLCIDALRRRKQNVSFDAAIPGTDGVSLESVLPGGQIPPDEQLVRSEQEARVQQAIRKLPEKYRLAVLLKYIDDLSLKEISEIMNIPVATVKTRIHRGRELLRKYLAPSGSDR